jgi:hypothetical protein
VRAARGSHPRRSPGRVWGHLRGDRATTRRRGRRPRAALPQRAALEPLDPSSGDRRVGNGGPARAIARSHEGRVVGHALGAERVARGPLRRTSRSRDHTKEGSSATCLGRSAWPSDHSVAAATVSDAGRRMTAATSRPPDSQGSISIRIAGGDDAPSRARRWVRSLLEGQMPAAKASDAALLVRTSLPDRTCQCGE